MTTAQKNAKAKFKQAIAYRQKTGVSLKEAFAHIYGKKKVGSVTKKSDHTAYDVLKYKGDIGIKKFKSLTPAQRVKGAKKAKTTKKVGALKLKPNEMRLGLLSSKVGATVKKKKAKKPSEQSILNKIHIVKKGVDKLDEAQHKHMIGKVNKNLAEDIKHTVDRINQIKNNIDNYNRTVFRSDLYPPFKKALQNDIKSFKLQLKEKETHLRELKKLLK